VRELAGFPEAVTIVGDGVIAASSGTPRAQARRSFLELPGGWLRVISGTLPSKDVLGFKAFHLTPSGVRYLCSLYRLSTGEPLALVDMNHLTVARTSAAAASAARRYWREKPITVAVIGSGTLARNGLEALSSVCRLTQIRVFSPRAPSRHSFAEDMRATTGLAVTVGESARDAADGADMILCATQTSGRIALTEQDAGSASYISSVSSTLPNQRELDAAILEDADLIVVDTPDALSESGDLLAANLGKLPHPNVLSLAEFLLDPGAASAGRTIYKSIGSIEQDLALAVGVWERATAVGKGERVADIELLRPA
jgi:ornithine cyclodeaminase/alanine dehydrogenase